MAGGIVFRRGSRFTSVHGRSRGNGLAVRVLGRDVITDAVAVVGGPWTVNGRVLFGQPLDHVP